jgi:hypothetical protein
VGYGLGEVLPPYDENAILLRDAYGLQFRKYKRALVNEHWEYVESLMHRLKNPELVLIRSIVMLYVMLFGVSLSH